MEPKFQTSFIPKKPLEANMPARVPVPVRGLGILSVAATIIFILSLLSAGGAFAYQRYIDNEISTKQENLKVSLDRFVEDDMPVTLLNLNDKLIMARKLISDHKTFSDVFAVLQNSLYSDLWLTDLKYTDENGISSVSAKGKARSFAVIALQEKKFAASSLFKNVSFSDFGLDENGIVKFTLKASIDWSEKLNTQ